MLPLCSPHGRLHPDPPPPQPLLTESLDFVSAAPLRRIQAADGDAARERLAELPKLHGRCGVPRRRQRRGAEVEGKKDVH